MAKTYKEKERALYESVRLLLIDKFRSMGGEVYLEDTSEGEFSPKLREALEFMMLHVLRVEKMKPDLTGYHQKTQTWIDRIVVEIKARKLRTKDLYQSKMYADVMNAAYCILVSSESLTREMREFINKRNLLTRPQKNVIITKYVKDENDLIIEPIVVRELYYGTVPEPFKVE